jgi:hypothetical protein
MTKYIWHWEWSMEDFDKEQELSAKWEKAMKEDPKQFPKMLTNTLFTGRCKGFRVIEAENEQQLANMIMFWWPTEDWWLEVALESQGEAMAKAMKKFPFSK